RRISGHARRLVLWHPYRDRVGIGPESRRSMNEPITAPGTPTMTIPAAQRPRLSHGCQALPKWLDEKQESQPVWRDGFGIFHVFRHADVQRVMADYATFSSDINRLRPGGDPFSAGSLMLTDPPEHRKLRRLISQAFSPKMSADMKPRIAELTEELLDDIEEDEFDLVEKFAHPLPIMVIAELLGIPIHDRSEEHTSELQSRENLVCR